jgi:hypothetical protein
MPIEEAKDAIPGPYSERVGLESMYVYARTSALDVITSKRCLM